MSTRLQVPNTNLCIQIGELGRTAFDGGKVTNEMIQQMQDLEKIEVRNGQWMESSRYPTEKISIIRTISAKLNGR